MLRTFRRFATPLTAFACATILASAAWAVPFTNRGPGGIGTLDGSSSLELWLKSDTQVFADAAGTIAATPTGSVVRWNDLSGNSRNAIADVGDREPTYTAAALNGASTLSFTGGAINTGSRMTVAANTIQFPAYPMTGNETAFFAIDFAAGMACCRGIMSDNNTFANDGYDGGLGGMFESAPFTFSADYRVNGINTPSVSGTPNTFHLITGLPVSTPVGNRALRLGSGHGGNADYGGRMGEVILFSSALNSAQQVIVENYVSARNGIAISGLDVYAGDTALNGDNDFDVVGVGRFNVSNVHTNGGSAGFGIEATGGLDADGEWVMAGHDDTANGYTNSGLSNPLDQRWSPAWYVDETGSVDVTIAFDSVEAGQGTLGPYTYLLFSSDGVTFTQTGISGTVTGDTVSFVLSAAMLADGFYTLGTNVPEPSTWMLLGCGAAGLAWRVRRQKGTQVVK